MQIYNSVLKKNLNSNVLKFSRKKWDRNFLVICPKYLDSFSKCSGLSGLVLTNCLLYVYYTQCVTEKMMASDSSNNMHIYTFSPTCLQSFLQFRAAV